MRHITYTCDRCGRQLYESECIAKINPEAYTQDDENFINHIKQPEEIESFGEHEFCMGCLLDILSYALKNPYIMENPETEDDTEPQKNDGEEEDKKSTAKVDVGKIKALYKAGWTVAKIADEMRCSDKTIYYHLKRIKENEK